MTIEAGLQAPLSIRVALVQQNSFELHCGRDSRPLDWKEVESLATTAGREYFSDDQSPKCQIGRRNSPN